MKNIDLFDALDLINPNYIDEARASKLKHNKNVKERACDGKLRTKCLSAVAAVLAMSILIVSLTILGPNSPHISLALSDVQYPDMTYKPTGDPDTDKYREQYSKWNNDIEKQKEYIPRLLEEFTKRINNDDILLYYGWTSSDATRAIADNIEPEELKDHANEIAKRWRLKEFVLDGIKEHHLEKEMDGKPLGELDNEDNADEIITELKSFFEESEWAEGATGDEYDYWYDLFGETTLKPLLMGEHYIDVDKALEEAMDGMTVDETIEFLGIEPVPRYKIKTFSVY